MNRFILILFAASALGSSERVYNAAASANQLASYYRAGTAVFWHPLTSNAAWSTTQTRDLSPVGTPCSTTGSPTISAADGIDLNGTTQWLTCSDRDAFSPTNGAGTDLPFTVSFWVYRTAETSAYVVAKNDTVAQREWHWAFTNTGRIAIVLWDNATGGYILQQSSAGTETPYLNTWTHYFLTYSGSKLASGILAYRNNVSVSLSPTTSGVYTAMRNTTAQLTIGCGDAGVAPFTGKIQTLKIFPKVLSSGERAAEYALGRQYAVANNKRIYSP